MLEEELEIVALRLTFGGAPGPYEWGVLSESICDLSIVIMQDSGWDPTSFCVPNVHLVPPPLFLDYSIPFAEGKDPVITCPVITATVITGPVITGTVITGPVIT